MGAARTGRPERFRPGEPSSWVDRGHSRGAVLVPFHTEVQAFFVSGNESDRMTIISVWRGESDTWTASYGGSTRLLEAFLSTMNVVPVP